jgi:hypothetical protein
MPAFQPTLSVAFDGFLVLPLSLLLYSSEIIPIHLQNLFTLLATA